MVMMMMMMIIMMMTLLDFAPLRSSPLAPPPLLGPSVHLALIVRIVIVIVIGAIIVCNSNSSPDNTLHCVKCEIRTYSSYGAIGAIMVMVMILVKKGTKK